jgi:hypothetical protein
MKTSCIKIYLFVSVIYFCTTYSQVTEVQKQQWIQNLSSENWDTVFSALVDIRWNKVVEALPALEANSYKQIDDIDLRISFFELLTRFKSPNAPTIIKNFMDSIAYYITLENRKGRRNIHLDLSDTLRFKLECAWYLFDVGDYSYIQLLLDDIQSLHPQPRELSWVKIFNEMPQYAHIVKPKIIEYINDTTKAGGIYKSRLLYDIEKKQGSDFSPDMLQLTRNCPDPWVRYDVLFDLVKMGYPNSLELLKEKFLKETFTIMKREIADTLLMRYGSINEYLFLKNNLATAIDTVEWSGMIKMIQEKLEAFIPPKPANSIPIRDLLESLITLIKNVQLQNWVGDKNFVKELNNYLKDAKRHLSKNDSLKCAKEVSEFQIEINREYWEGNSTPQGGRDKRFVTLEGWQFLYYNAQYIVERLAALPPMPTTRNELKRTDELKDELQNQSENKNIGRASLVKILTRLVDKAREKLENKPRLERVEEAVLNIICFQLLVDETWELTEKLEGKSPKGTDNQSEPSKAELSRELHKVFVYYEAYIALHYRAQYILEVLPKLRKDIYEQRKPMFEKDLQEELEKMKKSVEEK